MRVQLSAVRTVRRTSSKELCAVRRGDCAAVRRGECAPYVVVPDAAVRRGECAPNVVVPDAAARRGDCAPYVVRTVQLSVVGNVRRTS